MYELVPILGIIVPFATIAAIVFFAINAGATEKREVQETIRRAMESGKELTPEAISALYKPEKPATTDLRSGLVLTSLALGLTLGGVVFMVSGQDSDAAYGMWVAAAIVGSIGVGQLIAWFVRRDRQKG